MKSTAAPIRKTLKARDIPRSWGVALPDDPDAPVTVWVAPGAPPSGRRLADVIGAGKGVHRTRREADDHIRRLRDEWLGQDHR
jgi:hypothetical protein